MNRVSRVGGTTEHDIIKLIEHWRNEEYWSRRLGNFDRAVQYQQMADTMERHGSAVGCEFDEAHRHQHYGPWGLNNWPHPRLLRTDATLLGSSALSRKLLLGEDPRTT